MIFAKKMLKKNKIEKNSTWEGAFYQSEWAKINLSYFSFFYFMCVAAHVSKLFCVAHLANTEHF